MRHRNRRDIGLSLAAVCSAALLCLSCPAAASDTATQEKFRLGERMYREGLLPSGEPLRALIKGAPFAPGTAFSCAGCHLRSGLGSFADGIFTPAVSGAKLFRPLQAYSSATRDARPLLPGRSAQQNARIYPPTRLRPPYSEASLARALREGIDSAGRILNDGMPRYPLADEEMKLLISYLAKLSSGLSPGVSDTTIRFATIIADDVSPEMQRAMLIPLANFIKNKNRTNFLDPREGFRSKSTGYRSRVMAETTFGLQGVAIRQLELSTWVLHGAPETWRDQLEQYNRKEQVFAILGGITNATWEPIHQFCEEHQIPALFPSTDFPVISQTAWYTMYLSKGYYLEGEAGAVFLHDNGQVEGKQVIEVVRDTREGRELSRGFQKAWHDFEQKPPVTVLLQPGETLAAERLRELTRENPAAIILWDGPESLKALGMLAEARDRPALVLVSGGFLGAGMFALPEEVRAFTYLTYPYGMTQTPQEKRASSMGAKSFDAKANSIASIRVSQQAYILAILLDMALTDLRGNYYRDYLLDVIGTLMDQDVSLYERLSFGAGNRYASKGCYIVQLGDTGLFKSSGWLVH
jgi:hypothetical protein